MFNRRLRTWPSWCGAACFAVCGLLVAFSGDVYVGVTDMFVAMFFVYSALSVRHRLPVELTMDRVRFARRQTLGACVLALTFGGLSVGLRDRTDDRQIALLFGSLMILFGLAAAVSVWRMSRMISRGEIPEKVRRRWETYARRPGS